MQKQAPSIGRILVAIGFALSCFGLLLFLWIAFGGPVPLKPQAYRITADFPEATTLAQEADVRIGGVNVGKVKTLELAPVSEQVNGQDTTRVEMEIEPEFAPIATDARAILRQKTLLGETYVELTSGSEPARRSAPVALGAAANVSDAEAKGVKAIPEGGHLPNSQVEEATQIDEIFNALDEETRESFQRWQANAAVAIRDRGLDLNDAFGNLGPFLGDASDVLSTLRRQKAELKALVRDTGAVFEALTARDQELAGVITGSNETFDALASEERALAETFQILPTFQRESRLTFERLDRFQANTRPLVRDLIPVARELSPTLRSVRRFSPPLRNLFADLDKLIRVSDRGLPALRRFLRGLGPVLGALDPFLANLNPVIRYLRYQRTTVADFIGGTGTATAATADFQPGQNAPRHALRQYAMTLGAETLSIHLHRLNTNRGEGYLKPNAITGALAARSGVPPNYDCRNTEFPPPFEPAPEDAPETERFKGDGGEPPVGVGYAPCVIQPPFPEVFGGSRFPQLFEDSSITGR